MTSLDYIGNIYTPPDVEEAWKSWKANCGPCAFAALVGKPLANVRHCFPGHDRRGYAAPKHMLEACRLIGLTAEWSGDGGGGWPDYGFVRIQWNGSWMRPGIHPGAQWARTHWIAVARTTVYDCNPAFWVTREDWMAKVAPVIAGYVKGCDGGWSVRDSIRVEISMCGV